MNKVLIDISSLNENNNNAILGIKIFLSKHKEDADITIIADSNNTVTLNNKKGIRIAQTNSDDIEILDEYKNIKEKNLQILFTLIKKEKYNSFITFNTLDELKPYINKYFIKTTSPLLVASYANYKTHKCTILGDIGFNNHPSRDDLCSYLKSIKEYATKIYNFKTTKFKIMTNYNDELNRLFKSDKDYEGIINAKDIYNVNSDILLTDAHTCNTAISSIDGAISIYEEMIKDNINRNIGYKLMSMVIKGATSRFNLELDKKLTSGGMTLLGFDKKIIFSNKDVIAMGVKVAIDNAIKF